jgi:signal transduction histidine kinase
VPLQPGLDLAAYRIAQEALTNVVKHAWPAHATVTVHYRGGDVELAICDDGVGPGPGPTTAVPGRGLVGMRERAPSTAGASPPARQPAAATLCRPRLSLPAAP